MFISFNQVSGLSLWIGKHFTGIAECLFPSTRFLDCRCGLVNTSRGSLNVYFLPPGFWTVAVDW